MLAPGCEIAFASAICLGLGALGFALLRLHLRTVNVVDVLALAFPLGAGVFSLGLFIVSWLGSTVSLVSAVLVWGSLLLAAILARLVRPRGLPGAERVGAAHSLQISPGALVGVELGLVGACLIAAWLGIGRSYSAWDDMAIWALKGQLIARHGTVSAAGAFYPLNIPILISLFQFLGDNLPASKLLFPLFYLSLGNGCFRFWWQRGVPGPSAVLGAFCLASTPLLFEHATLGYVNLPYACYLALGSGEIVQGVLGEDVRRQLLGGLLMGMAVWTRPEGALAVLPLIVAMAVAVCLTGRRRLRSQAWILPSALFAGCRILFVATQGASGQMGQALDAAMQAIARGELHLGAFLYIVRFMARQAVEISVWGFLPLACAVLLILGARKMGPRANPDAFLVAVALAVVGAGSTSHYYLADFVGKLAKGMGNSANRMYMPVAVLATLLALLLTRGPMSGAVAPGGLGGHVVRSPAEIERDA